MSTLPLPAEFFQRQDPSDDHFFYGVPRLVVHIDESAIAALGSVYVDLIPPQSTILDLMSSWRSHYPQSLQPKRVIGLGMNAEELAQNPQLTRYSVQNLNAQPHLPYDDEVFDAVTCAVSVQYLTDPAAVFSQVRRVLKPGGVFIVSFSNRCFPTKAVAIWLSTDDQEHLALVGRYFQMAGDWADLNAQQTRVEDGYPRRADPLFVVWARKPGGAR